MGRADWRKLQAVSKENSVDVSKWLLDAHPFSLAERFAELDEVALLAEGVLVHDEDDALLEDVPVAI